MRKLHAAGKLDNGVESVTAYSHLVVLVFATLLGSGAEANPEFSHAHQRLAQYYQSKASLSINEAFWIRYNHLVISTSSKDAKKITKTVCNHLLSSGFASERPRITTVAHSTLQNRNSWNILAEQQCR